MFHLSFIPWLGLQGLHTVDLVDNSGTVAHVTTAPLPRAYLSMDWNERTGELYASSHTGVISVFRQLF